MRENRLKTIWQRGEAVVNGWLAIPSAFSAEVMAHQGFDSLTVDMQHGVVDYQVAVTMLQAIATTPVINRPELAIVGVNRMMIRPVWQGGQFVPRMMMNLSSSFDHRIIDGFEAAQFIRRMKELLEAPALLLVGN